MQFLVNLLKVRFADNSEIPNEKKSLVLECCITYLVMVISLIDFGGGISKIEVRY